MDYRDKLLEMVEEGYLDAYDALVMAMKWMSQDEVREMMKANELFELVE